MRLVVKIALSVAFGIYLLLMFVSGVEATFLPDLLSALAILFLLEISSSITRD